MNKKLAIFLLVTSLVVGACSQDKDIQPESSSDSKKTTDQTETAETITSESEETESAKEPMEIPTGSQASTIEEMASLPPGELTTGFSVEQETSMWKGSEVPSEIKEAFLMEMESITDKTQDAEKLYGALLHFLGGPHYNELVQPLLDYSPSFKEPILPEPYEMTTDGKQVTTPANAIILLDASSSMLLQANGKLKMDTAKSAVKGFAATIGTESDLSLYVYGHAGTQSQSDKNLSCGTIDEIYPLGEYKEKDFDKAVDQVKASGWTPLAGAIQQARLDFENTGDDITLYIVSDGAETCDGNPVEEAKKFAALSKDRHVNVIGFQVDQTTESQLKEVAEAGNGTYMAANSLEEMTSGISKLWLPSDLDLVSLVYQKPVGWPQAMALESVRRMADKATSAIRVESGRLVGAVNLLESEAMIEGETKEELLALIDEHRTAYQQLLKNLEEKKDTLIENEVERINTMIDDYHERMKNLKKK